MPRSLRGITHISANNRSYGTVKMVWIAVAYHLQIPQDLLQHVV